MAKFCHLKSCGKEILEEQSSFELRAHEQQRKICMYFDSMPCLKSWLRWFIDSRATGPERWELREFKKTGKICDYFDDTDALYSSLDDQKNGLPVYFEVGRFHPH
jgi:hypothetical protein